jgi:hypothetical protein
MAAGMESGWFTAHSRFVFGSTEIRFYMAARSHSTIEMDLAATDPPLPILGGMLRMLRSASALAGSHRLLTARVQAEVNAAYRNVVLDEYCADRANHDGEIEDFMREVWIVGMGHSLGARLQAVSCSDPRISKQCLSMDKRDRLIRSGWDGMVYLGFANWGARSLIPGMESLDGTARKRREAGRRRRRRQERREDRVGDGGIGRRNNIWDNGTDRHGRRRDGRDGNDD